MDETIRADKQTPSPQRPWHIRLLILVFFHTVRALVAVFARLPFSFAVFLGSLLARPWQWELKSTYQKNLTTCYGTGVWNDDRIKTFSRARADYFARFGIALGRLIAARTAALKKWSSFAGEDVLKQALDLNRGTIMVAPHYGLWLLGPAILAAHGHRVAVVVRRPSYRYQERFFQRLARRHGVKLINLGREAVPAIRQALHENMVICIAFDTPIRKGASARYRFGLGALRLDHGPAVLALRHRVPILFGIIPAGGTQHVQFRIETAANAINSHQPVTPDELMQAWCDQTYKHVTRLPEQWLRWNGRNVIEPVPLPVSASLHLTGNNPAPA